MAELVYATDLKSVGLNNLEGSSPSLPTNSNICSTNHPGNRGVLVSGRYTPPDDQLTFSSRPVSVTAFQVSLKVSTTWSKYEQLDALFELVGTCFQYGAEQLRPQGLICTVRRRDDHIVVRAERGGETVAGLDIRKGKQMGDDYITWSTNYRLSSENSFNGWAKPVFDKQVGVNAVEISDMGRIGRGDAGNASYEDFFTRLWELLVEQIEQRSR